MLIWGRNLAAGPEKKISDLQIFATRGKPGPCTAQLGLGEVL